MFISRDLMIFLGFLEGSKRTFSLKTVRMCLSKVNNYKEESKVKLCLRYLILERLLASYKFFRASSRIMIFDSYSLRGLW